MTKKKNMHGNNADQHGDISKRQPKRYSPDNVRGFPTIYMSKDYIEMLSQISTTGYVVCVLSTALTNFVFLTETWDDDADDSF